MIRSTGLWRAGTWLLFIIALIAVLPMTGPPVTAQPAKEQPGLTPSAPRAEAVARSSEIPFTDPVALLRRGGVMMYGIAACSVLLAAFFFERLIALRRARIIPRPFVRRILPQIRDGKLDQEQALALCRENGTILADVFGAAITKWGRPAVEVEQAIVDAGERATFSLRAHLRVFSAIHTLGPLLGLVGTVFGIIQAFNSLASQADIDRAERLANGIAQSLLATAFGLIVAIPALVFYLWFLSKGDKLVHELDGLAQDLVEMISAEALQVRSHEPRPSKSRRAPRPEMNPER